MMNSLKVNTFQKLILIIDDNLAIRTVLKELLELEGLKILTAPNGLEALKILETEQPQVILLDMRMPIMDGWEFRKIQRIHPVLSEIPVFIFCAGTEENEDFEEMDAAGFLRKPIDIDDLLKCLCPYL